jgi:predicted nucleotidyltransferase component of viral defense system
MATLVECPLKRRISINLIQRQDILDRAHEWSLRPDVVEKDYVLGWLLAAVTQNQETAENWIFKGGTCIKKCYFETYRFSEDLDFSLRPGANYRAIGIRGILGFLASTTAAMSGISFPENLVEIQERTNLQGQPTFRVKISYFGPLRQSSSASAPRILFDLTQHEPILDTPWLRPVFHPYPDVFPGEASVATYSLNELLAEKTRALYERTMPRDLYDVVYILDNPLDVLDLQAAGRLFEQKCRVKELPIPTVSQLMAIVERDEELRTEWSNMLSHQLPALPLLSDLLDRLRGLIAWIEQPIVVPPRRLFPSIPAAANQPPIISHGMRYWGRDRQLEVIRFAGANRLLVEFNYHGRHRITEPYSLRHAEGTGNLLFYAWELAAGTIKSFKVEEMESIQAMQTTFNPRYRVEFTSYGPLDAPPVRRSR